MRYTFKITNQNSELVALGGIDGETDKEILVKIGKQLNKCLLSNKEYSKLIIELNYGRENI